MAYAELLCCSNFTFQRGASHAQELVQRAKELGYSAIALTDECTLAGVVRAHEAAMEAGMKLIVGSQFRFPEGDRIALLAPTQSAYSELCELITRTRRAAEKGCYQVTREDFTQGAGHCIGLWIPGTRIDEAHARWFAALPLDFRALAFTHSLAQWSAERLTDLETLAARLDTPVVAVGDVHYHVRERRALHDVLTAIRLGKTVEQIGRAGFANGEHHLRPLATLRRLYPPHLLELTQTIAGRCEFSLATLHYEYPEELVPPGKTPNGHLRDLTEEGLKRRWPEGVPDGVRPIIEKELRLIQQLKFEHYFLTVEEIVRFARSRGIL